MNNSGYAMIQQTQDQWLNSNYSASSHEGGLSFPNYRSLANAFDLSYFEIYKDLDIGDAIKKVIGLEGPVLCNVIIPDKARVVPQVKFGRPNEDMDPLLPRDIFNKCMIIPPIA